MNLKPDLIDLHPIHPHSSKKKNFQRTKPSYVA